MAEDKQDPRLSALIEFYAEHPSSVLTPHIIEHWSEIKQLAAAAHEASFHTNTDAHEAYIFHSSKNLPVLPDVFQLILNSDEGMDKWLMVEQYMQQQGFNAEMLRFKTCGGEALVFEIQGVEDTLLKISGEHKMPSVVPYLNKPFTKAVFPMSQFEPQDSLHAVAEYDPASTNKNTENSKRSGPTGQISIALSPNLAGYYKDYFGIGDPKAVLYKVKGENSGQPNPPGWALDLSQAVKDELKNEGVLDGLQCLELKTVNKYSQAVAECPLSAAFSEHTYFLKDAKYNNFGCFVGFEHMPFVLDKRCVGIEKKRESPDYGWNKKPDSQPTNAYAAHFEAYKTLQNAVRRVYHRKYGKEDMAFSSIASQAAQYLDPPPASSISTPSYHPRQKLRGLE